VEYLDREVTGFHREDYYLAQIAAEIRRWKTKEKVKLGDFILDFHTDEKAPKKPQDCLNRSKSYWLGITGVTGSKRAKRKKRKPRKR